MQPSPELESATSELFAFLADKGVPHKVVKGEDGSAAWLPLARALRACGYQSPIDNKRGLPLDHAKTRKMLIAGRVQVCVELSAFGWIFGPNCGASAAQAFAVGVLNDYVLPQYRSGFIDEKAAGDLDLAVDLMERQEALATALGDPAFVEVLRQEGSRFVVHDGVIKLASAERQETVGDERQPFVMT